MMIGIIASQIILPSIAPKIDEVVVETEGIVAFNITNMSPKVCTIYFGLQGTTKTNTNLAPGQVRYQEYTGTVGSTATLEAYAQASDEDPSTTTTKAGTYYLPRTVTTPLITSVTGPGIGEATFTIKNQDITTVILYYRKAGDVTWISLGSTASGLTKNVTLTGDPNTLITIQAKAVSTELPVTYESDIEIKGQLTRDYSGQAIAPSITQLTYDVLGYIKFQFKNMDNSVGTLYYRRGTEAYTAVEVGTTGYVDKIYSGTAGEFVQVDAYYKTPAKLQSETTIFGGYYFRQTTTPTITSVQGGTAGVAVFTIRNQDSKTAEVFYRKWYSGIGAEVGWVSLGNANSGATKQQTLTGSPAETITLEARAKATSVNAGMSLVASKSQLTKDRAKQPTITSRPNDVPGRIIVRIANTDGTSGTLYYRRDSEAYTSVALTSGGYKDVTYDGTPNGSITIDAYYVTSGKDTSLTTTYVGRYLKPADVELYNKYVPGGDWSATYNNSSANVTVLSNPLSTYDSLIISAIYSYYDTYMGTEVYTTESKTVSGYGTYYGYDIKVTVSNTGAVSVLDYGPGPDGGFLNYPRVYMIVGHYN